MHTLTRFSQTIKRVNLCVLFFSPKRITAPSEYDLILLFWLFTNVHEHITLFLNLHECSKSECDSSTTKQYNGFRIHYRGTNNNNNNWSSIHDHRTCLHVIGTCNYRNWARNNNHEWRHNNSDPTHYNGYFYFYIKIEFKCYVVCNKRTFMYDISYFIIPYIVSRYLVYVCAFQGVHVNVNIKYYI